MSDHPSKGIATAEETIRYHAVNAWEQHLETKGRQLRYREADHYYNLESGRMCDCLRLIDSVSGEASCATCKSWLAPQPVRVPR